MKRDDLDPPFAFDDEPEFDRWIDNTIALVNLPVKEGEVDFKELPKPIDLSNLRDSLQLLAREVMEAYTVELDAHNLRRNPEEWKEWGGKKPPRKLKQGKKSDYIYGADTGVGHGDWDEHWRQTFHTPRGNPGTNRTEKDGPSLAPLHVVYFRVRDWWQQHVGKSFEPRFSYSVERPQQHKFKEYDLDYCNSEARLLTYITTWLDDRYEINNVQSICTAGRRVPKSGE
ncbi:hypothetical protein AB7M63_006784 [Bradyrhizobium japonicum]